MSDYVKLTDYASKDALSTGNPLKLIKGTEINDDFNAIQTAVATKADLASPDLLGNPTAPTQTTGNSTTRLANTAFVQQELDAAQAAVDITGGTIDGVAITGGTVIGLAIDLAVADGGTGASTLAANAVLLGNGTSAVQTVSPSTSGNILTSNGTTWTSAAPTYLGVGQTWLDVTSSRAFGSTYTNNRGKPILVSVSIAAAGPTNQEDFFVNSVKIAVGGVGSGSTENFMFLVPNSSTYRIVLTGSATIGIWAELR